MEAILDSKNDNEMPFQTASNVSETLEFHALCRSRFLDERFEQATQDTYFLSSLCGWVVKILTFIKTTTEIITFNVSCYWNASSLSVAPLPDRRAYKG
jgi:hypothetical protein